MSLRLDGKNALITGAASGIGRATALRFAQEGANVCVADRQASAAEQTAAEVRKLGRRSVAVQVDVSNPAQVQVMVGRAANELGGIDVVLAAAGVSAANYGEGKIEPKFLNELPFEDWRKVLSINLDGVFLTCTAVAREMIKQARGGRIIAISSGAAKIPLKGSGDYCVSKAGVWMLMKVMALELGRYNITANAIGPGVIDTPMTKEIQQGRRFERMVGGTPLKRIGKPEDVANTALFLASEEGSYFTGSILHPDGGVIMQ
ncbi:MAG TPA: SDR family NAD(P)-dependent oxidoreductase [Candidatus Binataceae bacterium]|nr:SDR family NAD(P)-dependent oxidoreductase [Candidatus Binataceae bacterium]